MKILFIYINKIYLYIYIFQIKDFPLQCRVGEGGGGISPASEECTVLKVDLLYALKRFALQTVVFSAWKMYGWWHQWG